MNSEDALFMLYTSGSTGAPKGLVHSTGGYLVHAAAACERIFDLRGGDRMGCVADVGWITGHSFVVYGPLAVGAATVVFESTPVYPDHNRYWQEVEKHRLTQLYTAPTAVRTLMQHGSDAPEAHDLSTLRVIGCAGEPLNSQAHLWLYDYVGGRQTTLTDTWWMTETGGPMLCGMPGLPMKPASCSVPFFGVEMAILDGETGAELEGECEGLLAIKYPGPGLARTILGDHGRYVDTYLSPFPGSFVTGDRARRDGDGFYFIEGRVDDVINVAGHRIGTAELETALDEHPDVAEAAVVGCAHDVKGTSLVAFVTLNSGVDESPTLAKELRELVRARIGGWASPEGIYSVAVLPKTRSGKIMRRLLRALVQGDPLGDTSTLADPTVVSELKRTLRP